MLSAAGAAGALAPTQITDRQRAALLQQQQQLIQAQQQAHLVSERRNFDQSDRFHLREGARAVDGWKQQ